LPVWCHRPQAACTHVVGGGFHSGLLLKVGIIILERSAGLSNGSCF
jgi:hypothetical protein